MLKLDKILTDKLNKMIQRDTCNHQWRPIKSNNKYVGRKCSICNKVKYLNK